MDGDGGFKPRYFLFALILLSIFSSCSDNKRKTTVTKSYYFWRTGKSITSSEIMFLKEHAISKLYVKLLDVDWRELDGAYPVSETSLEEIQHSFDEYKITDINLVPVLFITNKTFTKVDSASLPLLAKRVIRRCLPAWDSIDVEYEQGRSFKGSRPYFPTEIQFDCDWTVSTAGKYFYFLHIVDSLLRPEQITLSATIRLHQFKYTEKTGVPPVDRGMLMVYNISDLTQYGAGNSIFEPAKAGAYFTGKKYPLPMDIALPAYSWAIIFRDKQFYQIYNHLSESDLKKYSFLRSTGNHLYQVTQDTVALNLFLRRGDEIRAETIDNKLLLEAALLARKAVNTDSLSLALFELSESEIKNYDHETIEAVYNSYD